jgi:hypothetical protein
MKKVKRLLCTHDYERQSVYVDTGELVEKCRKCGDRVRTSTDTPRQSPGGSDARQRC